jgi:hypothetical protein
MKLMFDATPWMRGYAALRYFELGAADPNSEQRRVLEGLICRAASTKFGKDHGFDAINTVLEFQESVPLRRYEDFFREYWRPVFPQLVDCTWPGLIPYFALSSGTTTGKTKFVPCSREMLFANSHGAHDVLVHHVANRPWSRVLGGKCLLLGGSTALIEEAPGVYSGDLSGIETCEVPSWEAPWVFPPRELALIPDWEEKIDQLARSALNEDIRSVSGAPNWLLLFFEKLFSLRPGQERLARLFPDLELIIHGGINFTPYRKRFRAMLEGSRAETREVYVASEGFMATADRGDGEGLRLILDGGVFFEFVPLSEIKDPRPVRHWIGNVETGVEYALVVSTCSGLWAYILGDTVRLINRDPARLMITGRTSYVLSAVGEHVIAEEIEDAISAASAAVGASVTDYSVGCFPQEGAEPTPQHLYIVEFTGRVLDDRGADEFCRRLDDRLVSLNDDYASHRAKDFGLKPPEIIVVQPGTFSRWMKKRGKLGGQNKVPRIINDADLFADLRAFASSGSAIS